MNFPFFSPENSQASYPTPSKFPGRIEPSSTSKYLNKMTTPTLKQKATNFEGIKGIDGNVAIFHVQAFFEIAIFTMFANSNFVFCRLFIFYAEISLSQKSTKYLNHLNKSDSKNMLDTFPTF